MTTLRPGVTEADAMQYVNEYQQSYQLQEIDRSTWRQSIRPFAKLDKATWKSGGSVMYDVLFVQELAEYIAKRRVLIQLGHWHEKRPYKASDMENLVGKGVWDGDIDHPIFQERLSNENDSQI